jgi:1-acyl-sn-glycerol-3-phosphate acyltransferase
VIKLLGQTVLGVVSLVLLCLSTVFWSIPFFAIALAKVLVPTATWRLACARSLAKVAGLWIVTNNLGMAALHSTEWDIQGLDGLDPESCYLVNANHQTWLDVPVLQRTLNGRVPFLRFFLKQELIWLPILGQAWWALEMPFMKRYSPEVLVRRPDLRGKDLETTRRSCARLRNLPVAITNFVEGTRFTQAKHVAQGSPYRHLLKPKAGGVAFVLAAMGERLKELVDVTIVYPGGRPNLWDYVCGRVPRIVVRVVRRRIPAEFLSGRYAEDPVFRERFQAWLGEIWAAKDALIDELAAKAA